MAHTAGCVRGIQASIAGLPDDSGEKDMKKFLWTVGGVCAAAAGFLLWNTRRIQPVEVLAERLEQAWLDHHTRA